VIKSLLGVFLLLFCGCYVIRPFMHAMIAQSETFAEAYVRILVSKEQFLIALVSLPVHILIAPFATKEYIRTGRDPDDHLY
jgi:Ni,Fe-hydrogenase I cytochrome b subunit